MKKIIEWFKYHWHERIFKFTTLGGLILAYVELFHKAELNAFLTSPILITAIVSWLFATKDWK